MPYPLPLTRTEAYLAYKAGVIQQSDLKPSLAVPRNGIDAWLAYWTGLSLSYPVKNVGKNILSSEWESGTYNNSTGAKQGDTNAYRTSEKVAVQPNTTYIVSRDSAAVAMNFFEYDANGDFVAYTYKAIGSPITTSHTTKFITMSRGLSGGIDKMMLEEGESISQYAPYTGEPLILQEEEAYIAYLSGVINEYPEKCLRRVGAYLRYLISARWGRPDHPLNREELYLSLIKTQFIPSGDPSSDIEIDGTAKAAFVDVKMYGDTAQNRYEGKNLLPPDAEMTSGGITTSWNSDGTVDITGTATGSWPQMTTLPYSLGGTIPSGTQLTLSMTEPLPTGTRLWFREYDVGENTYINHTISNDGTSITFLASADMDRVGLVLGTTGGTTLDVRGLGIMLEVGNTATSFEPYVGRQPSPNPDYPQTVQAVTGLQTVTVSGKNIFDGQLEIGGWTINTGQTCTYATNNNAYRCINPIPVKPSSTYSLSVNGARFDGFRAIFCDSNMTVLSSVVVNNTIVTPASCAYITFYSSALKTQFPSLSDIKTSQIEKDSTVTTYEPYSSNNYEINLGKNLFDKDNARIYALNPASAGSALQPLTSACSTFIPITGEDTFTVSTTNRALLDTYASVYFISGTPDTATTWITRTSFGQNSSVTVTAPAGATYLGIYFLYSNNQTTIANAESTIQVEMGSTATPYAPYFKPIELCKLGSYQDYIWKDGGDWKVHKANGEYTLTSSVDITPNIDTSKTNTTRFQFTNILTEPSSTAGRDSLKCSHFVYANNWNYDTVGIQLANYATETSNTRFWFRIPKTIATTFDQLKSWLANNTVELYYPLATPTDTVITNQTLIDQLEALVAGGAENGTTYIKVNTADPNLPGLLVVEAPKYE